MENLKPRHWEYIKFKATHIIRVSSNIPIQVATRADGIPSTEQFDQQTTARYAVLDPRTFGIG